jgi:uncharacterized repeat protein (TIGR01451 family)
MNRRHRFGLVTGAVSAFAVRLAHSIVAAPMRALRQRRALLAWWGAVCLLSVPAAQLTAQDTAQIETELVAEVLVDGVARSVPAPARLAPATVVRQGEVVYYTVRIRNVSAEYARDVVVTQRIPANTVYVPDSAAGPGADVFFSIDGGYTFARASELHVVGDDGAKRPVPPEQYTHIQWRLRYALAPGAVALARFRAVFQ